MNVTLGLIFDRLCETYHAQCYWDECDERFWKRPAIFDACSEVEEGRIYIAAADNLPKRPEFTRDCFLICVGDEPRKNYLRGEFPFIWVENERFSEVFNHVLQWYDDYQQWDIRMREIVDADIDFGELTRISLPFIGNPVAVLDAEFYHVAITSWEDSAGNGHKFHVETPMFPIDLERLEDVSLARGIHKDVKGLFRPEDGYICSNLYVTGRFVGSVTVGERWRPFRKSDEEVIQNYVNWVERGFQKQAGIKNVQTSTLKSVVMDFLNKNAVSKYRVDHVTTDNQFFVCFKIMACGRSRKCLPVSYLCTLLENNFEGCVAMEYEGCIVGIVDFSIFPYDLETFLGKLEEFAKKMDFRIGVSGQFTEISEIWAYHRQAYHAYHLGVETDPDKRIYSFWDYASVYMLRSSLGEFSLEHLLPPKFRDLIKASEGGVDYVETLKCYLESNMNASLASRRLYLHRSSFLTRLERIWEILGHDFLTPDRKLYCQLLLLLLKNEE